jgi:hypothetical protein
MLQATWLIGIEPSFSASSGLSCSNSSSIAFSPTNKPAQSLSLANSIV